MAIVGIGQTEFKKNIGRTELEIALEAILAALADAGLAPRDVDGLVKYDMENTNEIELVNNLGLEDLRWFSHVPYGGGAGCGTIAHAVAAIQAGMAEVVVCYRARNRGSGGRPWTATGNRVPGVRAFDIPYGLVAPVQQIALVTRRHMYEYGTTQVHLGAVAVAQRAHAARNPAACMREPLTLEQHAAARMIADPLRLYDCCLETDGACAAVVTTLERARSLRQPPVLIRAADQGAARDAQEMTQYFKPDMLRNEAQHLPRRLFHTAGVTTKDIDCAQLYDVFTPLVLLALEAYGFCPVGESGPYVASGAIAWPDGGLPINTHGGSLSEAYIHGFNHILEGVRQIRGTSTCQVTGAELCLVTSALPVPTSACILGRDPR